MSRPFYIGIAGKARSGKDSFATALASDLCNKHEVAIVSLAAPIKAMIDVLLEYASLSNFVGGKEEEIPGLGVSPRVLYQTLGTEWGRTHIGEDLWFDVLTHSLSRRYTPAEIVIIPDIRFDNEAARVDMLFQINRKDCEKVVEHDSEAGVDKKYVTHFIRNNDDLTALHKKARAAAARTLDAYHEFLKDEQTN